MPDLSPKYQVANTPLTHSFGGTVDTMNQQPAQQPLNAGPTTMWQRVQQSGIQQVNALNIAKKAMSVGGSVGRFFLGGTAKLANQGIQEGKQVADTARMYTALASHNTTAFRNANAQSQKDYQGFNRNKGGILNAGTATSAQEAKQGSFTTGLKRIGGTTLESAGEIIPMAEIGKAAKVYKLGQGLVDATESAVRTITKSTVLGTISGAVGNTGYDIANNGKVNFLNTVKGAVAGGIMGGATSAAGIGIGKLFNIFKQGPITALDKMTNKGEKVPAMTDVMTGEQASKAAGAIRTDIPVQDQGSAAEKVGVRTPVRPGIKQVSETYKIGVRAPQRMSEGDYVKQFNTLSKSYDKAYKSLEGKTPAEQKMLGRAIDNQHQKALEQLNQDYQKGILPDKTTVKKIASSTSKAEKTIGGLPTDKSVNAKKVSDLGGKRENNALQTQIEQAHNAGDNAKTESLIQKLPDASTRDAMRSSVGLPTKETKLVLNRSTGKTERIPITENKPQIKPSEKTAPSQLSQKVNARAVANKLTEDLGTQTHEVMNIKEQASKAADLVNSDAQKAKDIALGKQDAPNGVHPHAIFTAVENKAIKEGDVETLRQLANSKRIDESTAAGQTLRILRERDNSSPVSAMQHIASERQKAFESKTGTKATEAVSKEVGKMKSSAKPVSKDAWSLFVESIKC